MSTSGRESLRPVRESRSSPRRKCEEAPTFSGPPSPDVFHRPSAAYLELTPVCNNRCPGCSNESFIADFETRALKPGVHRRPLEGVVWDRILDKLSPSVQSIALTGGEATLHPDFTAIATSLHRRAIRFVVFTNGRWHQADRLVAFIQGLTYFDGFLISLHGATAEAHDAFSGVPGSFAETVTNIERAVRACLPVTLSAVITRHNLNQLTELVELASELGAEEIVFNRYLVSADRVEQPIQGGALHNMILSPIELHAAVARIEALRTSNSSRVTIGYGPCIPQCFVVSGSRGCAAGEHFLVIDPWGNVKPCTDAPVYCGNLVTATLDEVWWSTAMQKWRGMIPEGCTGCAALTTCRTGCRAMALASGQGRDPLMREMIPIVESSTDLGLSVFSSMPVAVPTMRSGGTTS